MATFVIHNKMASFTPLGSGYITRSPTTVKQLETNESLRLVLGNCSTLLHLTELNMNETFNYVCEQWCITYNQPANSCCSDVHALAATIDVEDDEDESNSSFEGRLEEVYRTINKYRIIVQNLTLAAERKLCQIHWSRGLQCLYPTNCATTTDVKERTFCYFQTVKLNVDSLWSLFTDALTLLNRNLPMMSSTPTEDPNGELMAGLNDLLQLSRAFCAIQGVISSLNSLLPYNWK